MASDLFDDVSEMVAKELKTWSVPCEPYVSVTSAIASVLRRHFGDCQAIRFGARVGELQDENEQLKEKPAKLRAIIAMLEVERGELKAEVKRLRAVGLDILDDFARPNSWLRINEPGKLSEDEINENIEHYETVLQDGKVAP